MTLSSYKKRLYQQLLRYDCAQFAKKTESWGHYLQPGMSVLDVGCGDGRLSQYVRDRFACEVLGVDTIDYRSAEIPFIQYDGHRLPFGDNTYDVAYCLAVIHHTASPERMVQELCRVARRVVLIEDYCATRLGKIGLHVNDYFTNIVQNVYKVWCGYRKGRVFHMQWRLQFRTERELRAIFQRSNMHLESFERTVPSWKGMSHGVYVLH